MSEWTTIAREAITTTAGTEWSSEVVRRADGTMKTVYRRGSKFASAEQYKAAKSHTPVSEMVRGNLEPSDVDPSNLNDPFTARIFDPIELFPEGSELREQQAERNRFLGFLESRDTPDDRVEAALEYQKMTRELEGVRDQTERERIKTTYNIGGS